ncbi:peroxidase superfamily protein isoform X2 [Wolffia australiana]
MASRPSFLSRISNALLLLFLFFSSSDYVDCFYSAANQTRIRHPLSRDFYAKTCPQVDELVASVTRQQFQTSPASGPAIVRIFFHDCFGCDASVLIAPGPRGAPQVERDMPENKNLAMAGFETINQAKSLLEKKCPGVVSCADIIAIAARDFLHLAGGPFYEVNKGRRDSRVSLGRLVNANLPRANSTVDELITLFRRKGLNQEDLVALSGAHTVGFSHCHHFLGRLYNFQGTRRADPSIDPRLLKALQMSCPPFGGSDEVVVPFDVQTPFSFDHAYYGNLQSKMGLLLTDQALFLDPRTRPTVQGLAMDKGKFFASFAAGMEKMGAFGVKKGRKGEHRTDCFRHAV